MMQLLSTLKLMIFHFVCMLQDVFHEASAAAEQTAASIEQISGSA
jgi:hypothetical protein